MNYKKQSSNPLDLMEDYFKLKRCSKNTVNSYISYIKRVRLFSNKDIYHLTFNDFHQFLLSYSNSESFSNQVINAAKIYFKYGLHKQEKYLDNLYRPKKKESLPNVIPENYLKTSLNNIKNLKHKAILSLTYSIGLRLGDVQRLKIANLSSKTMQVKIINGKGNKDAYLPLYENVKNILFEYCNYYKPKEYLFEGQFGGIYSSTSLNKIVKKHIGEEYHFHNLRHSFATHLLNKGVDVKFIQKMLRHKDIKTTMIYLKVTTEDLSKLPQLI